jgi:hypothetical protein
MRHAFFLLPACIFLSACETAPPKDLKPWPDFLARRELMQPKPNDFEHCRGYGCPYKDRVSLNKKEWNKVRTAFNGAKTPRQERFAVSRAVGLMERIVGPKTGTHVDVGDTFKKTGDYQLDCVDESNNTTMYLGMMENAKLLKFHKVVGPVGRTPATTMAVGKYWPHFAAVMVEKKTGTAYAVDSWLNDNGAAADVIPLNDWFYGADKGETAKMEK